jgi:hypothetical protein
MGDVIYLSIIVAFFAFAALVVKACERIIGPDELLTPVVADDAEQVAA